MIAGMASIFLLTGIGMASGEPMAPRNPVELFTETNIWKVHLQFSAEEWETMEPAQGAGGFPFGGPGRRGGPPGGGPRPEDFGPGLFIAPVFVREGDLNRDEKLSRDEFAGLGRKWFAAWDSEKSGKLTEEQLQKGLDAIFGSPGMGAGGPGQGGGMRGGPPGMLLQGREGQRNGLASSMGIEFKYVHADLEFAGMTLKDVAVRYKGNGTYMQSRDSNKRSLKVDVNKYVKGRHLAGVTQLNFHNNVTDASWMNEVLSHRLFRDAGVPAPRTAYARVYITVPGKHNREYLGLYSLVEDIDTPFLEERFGTRKGALFKPVTRELFNYLGEDWSKYAQTYDSKIGLSKREKQRVIDFAKIVSEAPEAEFAAKLGEYVDLEEFARFMAVTVWLSTLDSILSVGQNYYVYLDPKTLRFQFFPWDLDHSFGQFPMIGTQEQREKLSVRKPWQGESRFLERVFKVEAFKKIYLTRLSEFSTSVFLPGRTSQLVDLFGAAIRPAVKEESERKLARFDQVVAGQPVEPEFFGGPRRGGGPGGDVLRGPGQGGGPPFGGPGGFFQPVKPIKGFVKARSDSVTEQLAGKSEGEMLDGFGFGPPGGGRGGGGGPGGPGGRDFFRPGMFLGGPFKEALDANKDGSITRDEVRESFDQWFESWDSEKTGMLAEAQVRAGLNRELGMRLGGPGGPGFGPPGGPVQPTMMPLPGPPPGR
jgi:hypothetical protein